MVKTLEEVPNLKNQNDPPINLVPFGRGLFKDLIRRADHNVSI